MKKTIGQMILLVIILIAGIQVVQAQSSDPKITNNQNSSQPAAEEEEQGIQDNSFLIEEAYNQDPGVVQHISIFTRSGGAWSYNFTDELPIVTMKHQFSFSLPFLGQGVDDGGIGDVALNYRYQLVGSADSRIAIAPRFTVIIPTGDEKKGLGLDATGVQFGLPVSFVLNKHFVTHFNAGVTYTHSAHNDVGEQAATVGYNFGQSLVWLAKPRFNVLAEVVFNSNEDVIGNGQTSRENLVTFAPGIRVAQNFKNGLQIVPGIALTLTGGNGHVEKGVLFYLSFEHPFTRKR